MRINEDDPTYVDQEEDREDREQYHADETLDIRITPLSVKNLKESIWAFLLHEGGTWAHPDKGLYTEARALLEELQKRGTYDA